MSKPRYLSLVALILSTALTACGPAPTPQPTPVPTTPPPAAFPLTLADDAGAEVTIAAEPQRIVSMAPSHTEILYALGLGDKVVGVTKYCDYPPQAKEKTQVGGFSKIDLEQVVALEPDLVLGTSIHAQTVAPALRERGIIVILVDPQDVPGVLDKIMLVGQATGATEAAAALVSNLRARIEAVTAKTQAVASKPRVYWELTNDLHTVGPGSFIDDIIAKAGGINVAADATEKWPQLNLEALILADPQVIILADHPYGETADTVKARPGWADVSAVKEGRIIEVPDPNVVSRPGPRVADAIEFVAKALHPELFE